MALSERRHETAVVVRSEKRLKVQQLWRREMSRRYTSTPLGNWGSREIARGMSQVCFAQQLVLLARRLLERFRSFCPSPARGRGRGSGRIALSRLNGDWRRRLHKCELTNGVDSDGSRWCFRPAAISGVPFGDAGESGHLCNSITPSRIRRSAAGRHEGQLPAECIRRALLLSCRLLNADSFLD